MKKLISLVLVIATVSTMILPAVAAEVSDSMYATFEAKQMVVEHTGDAMVEKELLETVQEDIALLSQAHLKDGVQIHELKSDGTVVYEYPVSEDITDYIEVQEIDNGDIVLNIVEGVINNELVYTQDGRVLLDGYEVMAHTAVEYTSFNPSPVLRAGARSRIIAISIPKNASGTGLVIPSNFLPTSKPYAGPYVTFQTSLGNIAVGVIISTIVNYCAGGLAAAIAGLSTSIVATVLSEALQLSKNQMLELKSANPNSKILTFKSYPYAMKGNDSIYSEWIYEFKLYGNATYDGKPAFASAKKILETT